jgi:hypothetical protein
MPIILNIPHTHNRVWAGSGQYVIETWVPRDTHNLFRCVTAESLFLFECFSIYDIYKTCESSCCQQIWIQNVPLDTTDGAVQIHDFKKREIVLLTFLIKSILEKVNWAVFRASHNSIHVPVGFKNGRLGQMNTRNNFASFSINNFNRPSHRGNTQKILFGWVNPQRFPWEWVNLWITFYLLLPLLDNSCNLYPI